MKNGQTLTHLQQRFSSLAAAFQRLKNPASPGPDQSREETQRIADTLKDPEQALETLKGLAAGKHLWHEQAGLIFRHRHELFGEHAEGLKDVFAVSTKAYLEQLATARAGLIQDEADGLLTLSGLAHERVSLVARYHEPIFGEDVPAAVREIEAGLHQGAEVENQAILRLKSLDGVPQTNVLRDAGLREQISVASQESQRLLTALSGPPLPPDELAAFHSIYQTPTDPLFAFSANTAQMADAYLTLGAVALDRAQNVMTYVEAIDAVVKPQRPELTEYFTGEQQKTLGDMKDGLLTGARYLETAEKFGAKPVPF